METINLRTNPQSVVLLREAFKRASRIARETAEAEYRKRGEGDVCGMAWVSIRVKRTNSIEAKLLIGAGFSKSGRGLLSLWDPARYPTQALYCSEVGAIAFANSFKADFPQLDIEWHSRWD